MLETKIHTRQKDGGWQAIVSYKVNYRWKTKSKQGFKTEREALKKAKEIEYELQKEVKSGIVHSDMTVGELREIWLDYKKSEGREEETISIYKRATAILEPLFRERVSDITEYKLTSFFLKKRKEKGYSYHEHQKMVRAMFSFAVDSLQIIPRNPVKVLSNTSKDKRDKYVEKEKLTKILNQNISLARKLAIRIIAETGCRTCEAFGLTIHDVTPYQVDINKKMTRKTHTFGPLKNKEKGKRICPISKELYQDIISYYNSKENQNMDGRIFEKRFNLLHAFKNENFSPHCLRHTHATDLVAMGINPVEAAALIGDTYQTFSSTYIHSNKAEREKAVDIIRQMKLDVAK